MIRLRAVLTFEHIGIRTNVYRCEGSGPLSISNKYHVVFSVIRGEQTVTCSCRCHFHAPLLAYTSELHWFCPVSSAANGWHTCIYANIRSV